MAFRSLHPRSAHGRQAEARRNDLAVLEAARDVFAVLGADAPVAAVAARAGVGVGTLYRRYGSKTELLQRLCMAAMEQAQAAADAALRSPDPWAGLAGYIRDCVGMRSGALAALAGQVAVTEEMLATAERGIAAVTEIVVRAQRAGSLRRDVTPLDIALLIEAFSRRPQALSGPADDRDARDRLLAITLDGLRAGQPAPLPGRPPGRDAYVARWAR
jgi:AcrR family transcriptional regulator